MMEINELLQNKEAEILSLAGRQNAYNLRICGAMASNTSPKPPYLDMLVEIAQSHSFFDLLGFGQDLDGLLGCKVEVGPDNAVSICLQERINAEPLRLF